jgi:hypothetical protein
VGKRHVRRWTASEIDLLRVRWNDQTLISEIAKGFGRTRPGVAQKAAKIGLPPKPLPNWDVSIICQDCGKETLTPYYASHTKKYCKPCATWRHNSRMGCCRRIAKQKQPKPPRKTYWTEERLTEARSLCDEGLSRRQIASKFGVSHNAVIGALYRRDVPSNYVRPKSEKKPRRKRFEFGGPSSRQVRVNPFDQAVAKALPGPSFSVPESEWVHFMELTKTQCHAPMGNGQLRCGRPVAYKSYCCDHAKAFHARGARL